MRSLGVILVHFHTPALLAQAVDALWGDAGSSGLDLEIVVVDNGSTAEERSALTAWRERQVALGRPAKILDPGRNLGYAAGLGAGARLLPGREVLLLMNPDVLVLPGCLARLAARLEAGAAVAGPLFFWDREDGFVLPPTEAVHFGDDLLRVAAARRGGWVAAAARRRWRRHARRFAVAREAFESYDLSGALLMVEAGAFGRLGGFDERYELYFEETDFLQRLRRAGLSAQFEPRAKAIHLYAQSTPQDGSGAARFAASQGFFRRFAYGRLGAAVLEALSRGGRPAAPPAAEELAATAAWRLDGAARWLELSPSPLSFPAAARRLPPGLAVLEPVLSPELLGRMAPGSYWLRTLEEDGRELGLARVEVPAATPAQTRSPSPSV